jgi:ubiquinone/menaquinone biosynthesis C-methylase UbiE
VGNIVDGVFDMTTSGRMPSAFDNARELIRSDRDDAAADLFQSRQLKRIEGYLGPTDVVLDVGCGPQRSYQTPADCVVIGIDHSWELVRANSELHLPVYGDATHLPFLPASIDTIICSYAIHHLVGTTTAETLQNVTAAFAEFDRVLKPGGQLLVLEISPWRPFALLQRYAWNTVRQLLGDRLSMFFWQIATLESIAAQRAPSLVQRHFERFPIKATQTFAPIFALPKLRVPGFLYPFDPYLCRWQRHERTPHT